MKANKTTKSVNDIMNQANRLMAECNAKRNFKRSDAIRKIAFRYFDNIRACAGSFNSNDDAEYSKQYSRAQYMNGVKATFSLTSIIANPLDYLEANGITGDAKFRYMLLDRMQQDITYYLGYGNRCARQLWAGDETKQIKIMVALWMAAPEAPEWLSFDQINEYAKQMKVAI